MRRSWAERDGGKTIGWLVTIVLAVAATGGHAAPPLPPVTYASALRSVLEHEMTELGTVERGASEVRRALLRAAINVRITAAELLEQGEAAGHAGSVSVLAGLRLAHGRRDLDDLLGAVATMLAESATRGDGAPESADALRAVLRFNDAAIGEAPSIRTVEAVALDAGLARMFAPLAGLAEIVHGIAPVSHWPLAPPPAAGPAVSGGDGAGVGGAALAARIAAAPLPETVRTRLGALVSTPSAADLVTAALDAAAALAAARGFGDDDRDALLARVDAAVAPAGDAASLRALREVVSAIDALAANEVDAAPLVVALHAAGTDGARLERLATLATRMRGVHTASADHPRLRALVLRLRRAALRAETILLGDPAALGGAADAAPEPDWMAARDEFVRRADDLERVVTADRSVRAVTAFHPRIERFFAARCARLGQRLTDAARRDEAARTLDGMRDELARFRALPFEGELRAATARAVRATGGRHVEFVSFIQQVRRAWAEAWSREDPVNEAVIRLALLARLTRVMEDAGEALWLADRPLRLDRWAAWEMPRDHLNRAVGDLPSRLKLATAATLAGDDVQLATHVTRLEQAAPLARLVGRLAVRLDEDLAALPDGALSVLGRTIHPPPAHGRYVAWRIELADLCRYGVEIAGAREPELTPLRSFVNARAEAMLDAFPDE